MLMMLSGRRVTPSPPRTAPAPQVIMPINAIISKDLESGSEGGRGPSAGEKVAAFKGSIDHKAALVSSKVGEEAQPDIVRY